MQRVVARCLEAEVDVASYNRNRELLYNSLREYGYTCIKPEGAFYLFVKALEEDDKAFAEAAKKHNILIVPGSSFGCPGFCRIAYCVAYDTIKRSLPEFKKLEEEYRAVDRS
jgi:aspartate aminotransferase